MKRILISIKNNKIDRFSSKIKHNKFEKAPNLILTLILTIKHKLICFFLKSEIKNLLKTLPQNVDAKV